MQRLHAHHQRGEAQLTAQAPIAEDNENFLIFQLGGDEFALPIHAVVEISALPTQITRVPKTPKFLEGVVNLRGAVLPVIDLRRRFDMPLSNGEKGRRLVVVRSERHRAGLVVDGVSEVLRTSEAAIEGAPDLTDDIARLISGVINLDALGRIILLLSPPELLTRAERGILDKFQVDQGRVASD
jgi:purine-binding chemotaxis protein CheW